MIPRQERVVAHAVQNLLASALLFLEGREETSLMVFIIIFFHLKYAPDCPYILVLIESYRTKMTFALYRLETGEFLLMIHLLDKQIEASFRPKN